MDAINTCNIKNIAIKTALLTIAATLSWTVAASSAQAGAWTQPEGEFYLKLWDRSLLGTGVFLADGEALSDDSLQSYQDHQLGLYGEWGLTDKVTLMASGSPIGFASQGGEQTLYVGPLALGARYGILDSALHLSVEGHYSYAPGIGEKNLSTQVVQGNTLVYIPTVENHYGELSLHAGYGFNFGGWAQVSLGGRANSGEGIDSAIVSFAQFGYRISESSLVDVHFNTYLPLGDVEVNNISGAGQTQYVGFGLAYSYWFTPHVGANIGFEGALMAASNAATPSLLVGVEFK